MGTVTSCYWYIYVNRYLSAGDMCHSQHVVGGGGGGGGGGGREGERWVCMVMDDQGSYV